MIGSSERDRFYLLHGFLGLPTDWDSLIERLCDFTQTVRADFRAIDLFAEDLVTPDAGIEGWALNFRQSVVSELCGGRRILLGYSLGARLALHTLIADPGIWNFAILVSPNPGLINGDERRRRLESDEALARRFETDRWDELMRTWNSLEVFGSRPPAFIRREGEYKRTDLAMALRNWSLGRQTYLIPFLKRINLPVLWIVGEFDQKFVRIALEVQRMLPHIALAIIPGAGHRVPWENPSAFIQTVLTFLRTKNAQSRAFSA